MLFYFSSQKKRFRGRMNSSILSIQDGVSKWAKEKHNVSCWVFSRVRKPNETCRVGFSHA